MGVISEYQMNFEIVTSSLDVGFYVLKCFLNHTNVTL